MQAEIVPDCVAQNGTSSCYVANNTRQQCMPGTYEEGARQLGKLTMCPLLTAAPLPANSRGPVADLGTVILLVGCFSNTLEVFCSSRACSSRLLLVRDSVSTSSKAASNSLWSCAAAQHAAAAQHRHHGGIVAGSVIGALAAVAVFAALIAALCTRKERSRWDTALV